MNNKTMNLKEYVDIYNIKSELVYNRRTEALCLTEELQSKWQVMNDDEKIEWYEIETVRKKLNARDILESAFDDLENNEDGYQDMANICMNGVSEENIKRLQAVLDDICNSSEFDVYIPTREVL